MKTKKILILASVFVALATLTTGCKKEIEVKDGSKVAVSVKGKKVTATEFYDSIKENNISELVDMIDHGLFDKKYPSDEKEKKEIDEQVNQLKSIYGKDENTFKTVLNQGFGVNSEEELREMLSLEHKRNLAVNDYIKDHLKDDEIEKYYQENIFGEAKASHILISLNVKEDASDEEKEEAQKVALEKAKKVIKELKDGKDFKKLAKKYSDDEKTAKNGGDLGFFNYDEMEDSFSEACKDLKKKEYTKEPVKTKYGYHIILKTDEKDKPKLKDVKNDIKETLTKNKLNNDATLHYQTLIDIREDKKITWNDDVLKKSYNDLMKQLLEAAKKNNQNNQ